jgi:hypothetical protein
MTYTPRPDATPEAELNALAVYRFLIFESNASKEAAHPGGPDDAERSLSEIGATKKCTR